MKPKNLALVLACISTLVITSSCKQEDDRNSSGKRSNGASIPRTGQIVEKEDGLIYLKDAKTPYSGPVILPDPTGYLRYTANYQGGKLHGPEMKFGAEGRIRRWFDWIDGEKVRHRDFYESGQLKRDAMFKGGHAIGKHRTWSESGMLKFDGAFAPGLQWHGHIRDRDDDGKILWDAHFENGQYLRGIYPKSEEKNLIDRGLIDPETLLPTSGSKESP